MKKTDLAMIIFIASFSIIVAFFIAKAIFGGVYTGTAKVKTVDAISATVEKPSKAIFNSSAINPAVQVEISSNSSSGNQ